MESLFKANFTVLYKKYFAGSFFVFFSLVSAAINYLYYPLLARLLDADSFGASQSLIAVLSQASSVFSGLSLVTIYLVVSHKHLASRYIATLQKLVIGIIIILAILVLIFSKNIEAFLHLSNSSYVYIVLFDLFAIVPFITTFGYLVGKKRFIAAALLQLTGVVLKLIIGCLLALKFGITGALLGIGIGQLLAILFMWTVSRITNTIKWDQDILKAFNPLSKEEFKDIKPFMPVILSLLLVSACTALFASIDVLIARNLLSGLNSGLYASASTLATIILFASLPMLNVAMPHITPGKIQSAHKMILKIIGLMLVICAITTIIFALIPGFLLNIYGSHYIEIGPILWHFGLYMSIVTTFIFILQTLSFHKPKLSAVGGLVTVTLLILSVPHIASNALNILNTLSTIFAIMLLILLAYILWLYTHEKYHKI